MNKRFLLPCLGLLCSLGSFAYEKGDYVFTPEQRLKVTGSSNLVVNGDFSNLSPADANFGWKATTGSNVSTEMWTLSADGGYNGKGAIISQSVDEAATIYQAVPFTSGQTLLVSFKIKVPENGAFSSSTTAGAANYVDVYANADGSANKSADRFQQVASSVALAEGDWQDVAFCFKDTVSGGSAGSVIISLGRLPEGTVVSDFEVKEAKQVYDTRIADRMYRYIDWLKETGKFPEGQDEFAEQYGELKEIINTTDEIGDAEASAEQLITLRDEWLDNNSTDLIKYINKYDISALGKYNNKDLSTIGDWSFTGGRWGHKKGEVDFTSDINGNYNLGSQTATITHALGGSFAADAEYLFSMEAYNYFYMNKKGDNDWYSIDYSVPASDVRMFVGADTLTWDNVSQRAYGEYGAIGKMPEGSENLIVGINFPMREQDTRLYGGHVTCKSPSLRIIGYSQKAIERAKYIGDVYLQQTELGKRLTLAQEDIADAQRPWGNDALNDSVVKYKPLYDESLNYVDTEGKDLKNPEMPEEGYDATLLAGVRAMNSARNAFSKLNAPFTNIVSSIANAEDTKKLRVYSGSTKRAELDAAIASAQALHDAKLTATFNSADSLALVEENTKLVAAIEAYKAAVPETVLADIDFGTQENPTKIMERSSQAAEGEDPELTYYIPGAVGEMVLSDSTVCSLGVNGTDSLGMLHFGNTEGTVNFTGAPAKSTDIVKFTFDYYFGNYIKHNAGYYIKDAEGNNIAGLYFSKYSGTDEINTFGVNYNSNIAGVGKGGSTAAQVAALSNRTHFEVVLDYGKGKMYCETSGSKGTFRTDEVDLATAQVPATFVMKSNYDNAARMCWFDNLKIVNIAAGEYDGIFSVNSDKVEVKNANVKYNLAGQRIMTPSKGQVYIMNGKKYIAK